MAWVSQNLFGWAVFTIGHGLNRGMRWKGGLGWIPFGPSEDKESAFWRQLAADRKLDGVVYDVGAFEGVLSLFFAKTAKEVVSFEPVAANRRRLLRNAELNRLLDKKIKVMPYALGAEPGTANISRDPLFGGCSSLVHGRGSAHSEAVSVVTLDEMVMADRIAPPDFVKIDVEGFEREVLRGAARTLRNYQPQVFVELHGDTVAEKRADAAGVLELLEDAGFESILHVETGRRVASSDGAEIPYQGHFYAAATATLNRNVLSALSR